MFGLQFTNEYAIIGASGVGSEKMMMGARTVDDLRLLSDDSRFDLAEPEPAASVSCNKDDPAVVAKRICAMVLN